MQMIFINRRIHRRALSSVPIRTEVNGEIKIHQSTSYVSDSIPRYSLVVRHISAFIRIYSDINISNIGKRNFA